MKLFYTIPIVIGFGIDIIYFGKWTMAYLKRKDIPNPGFDAISIFVLPAWGISGLMIFGRQPKEMFRVWNSFLVVLLLAFCVHLFICYALPFSFIMICNLFYGRKLFDMSSLPDKKLEN